MLRKPDNTITGTPELPGDVLNRLKGRRISPTAFDQAQKID